MNPSFGQQTRWEMRMLNLKHDKVRTDKLKNDYIIWMIEVTSIEDN